VAGRVDDTPFERADADRIALTNRRVYMGNALRLIARRNDAALVMRLEFANALGVIGVMMRDENIREPPAGFGERRLDRGGLWSVDRGGGAGFRIVQQNAEIILEAGKKVRLRGLGPIPDRVVPRIIGFRG
jgi:hypothetical protein